ncbi:MAG: hypothetical protein LBI13_11230 [Streptococcaceae bacterium]|nr:hypothetical protein [Streptococcaceae bacterium]
MRHIEIEFNETGEFVGDFSGRKLSQDLLDLIKWLDERAEIRDNGYYKFYFEEIEAGEVKSRFRVDIGDGWKCNGDIYEYFDEFLEENITV